VLYSTFVGGSVQLDFGTRASCIEGVFEDGVDGEEDFDLELLQERWLFALLETDSSFFFEEEATLRDFCLDWRLPPLMRLA